MRIELAIDGGFAAIPGLAKPILLDAANLSPELVAEFERRVEAAQAEDSQRGSAKPASVPDGRRYRLTIYRDDQRRQIEAADPTIPPAFAALMEFIKANGRR